MIYFVDKIKNPLFLILLDIKEIVLLRNNLLFMRIFTLLLTIVFFCNTIHANHFVFSGNGNWSNNSLWVPNMPTTLNMQLNDTIDINGMCYIQPNEQIQISINGKYNITGYLENNGSLSLIGDVVIDSNGILMNNNVFYLNPWNINAPSTNELVNYGSLINAGMLKIVGTYSGNLTNYGSVTNSGVLHVDQYFSNYAQIQALADGYLGSLQAIYNYSVISGHINTSGIYSDQNSTINIGIEKYFTDSMFVKNTLWAYGNVSMDINSNTDLDVIFTDSCSSIGFHNVSVNINPSFNPLITDTFVLIANKVPSQNGLYSLENIDINVMPSFTPIGYYWSLIKTADKVYLVLNAGFPLPFESMKFSVIKKNNQSILNWKLLNETNIDNFIIERADENLHFETIGQININQLLEYSFIDKAPILGENYYRIKVVDLDKKIRYSQIVELIYNKNSTPVLNTIFQDELKLNIDYVQQIQLLDINGKVLESILLEPGFHSINTSNLTKGIYFVKTEYMVTKIIKP
jgi:hypothetical protein